MCSSAEYYVFYRWTSVYPIYLDAKRHYRKGCRRIAYDQAVLFPQSLHMTKAVARLGLQYAHEVSYCMKPISRVEAGQLQGSALF